MDLLIVISIDSIVVLGIGTFYRSLPSNFVPATQILPLGRKVIKSDADRATILPFELVLVVALGSLFSSEVFHGLTKGLYRFSNR